MGNFEIKKKNWKKLDLKNFSTSFLKKNFFLQSQFYFVFSLIKISYVKMYMNHPKLSKTYILNKLQEKQDFAGIWVASLIGKLKRALHDTCTVWPKMLGASAFYSITNSFLNFFFHKNCYVCRFLTYKKYSQFFLKNCQKCLNSENGLKFDWETSYIYDRLILDWKIE